MAATPGLPMQDLFRPPHIQGVVSDFAPVGSPMAAYYGVDRTKAPGQVLPLGITSWGYDVMDRPRNVGGFQDTGAGPSVVQARQGHARSHTLFHQAQMLRVMKSEYWNLRSIGGAFDTINPTGQDRINRRITDHLIAMDNTLEWLWFATLTNRVKLKYTADGASMYPVLTGEDIAPDYARPSELSGYLPIGYQGSATPTSNIISASFSDTSTPIIDILSNIRARSISYAGWPLTEFIVNTTTMNAMRANDQLQEQGGSSFRVFDSLTYQQIGATGTAASIQDNLSGMKLDGSYIMTFRALGERFKFHVVDTTFNIYGQTNSTALADQIPAVPDGMMICTPAAGDHSWYERVDGTGVLQQYDGSPVEEYTGFGQVARELAKPEPSHEVEFARKYTFALKSKLAVWTPTVMF